MDHIIIADNGIGMTPEELNDAIKMGHTNNNSLDIHMSHYGIGLKTAGWSLGNVLVVVSRDSEGNLSYAHLNCTTIMEGNGDYVSPLAEAPLDAHTLWNQYALNKDDTGTLVVIREPRTKQKPANFMRKLRKERAPESIAARYNKFINSGALEITTQQGEQGNVEVLEAPDPLGRDDQGVVIHTSHSDTFKLSDTVSVDYDVTVVEHPEGHPSQAGLYAYVGDTLLKLDQDTWFGMFKPGTVHSYRYPIRVEVLFATKSEFFKVAEFAAAKHDLKLREPSFSDHLRDSRYVGQVIRNIEKARRKSKDAEKLLKTKAQLDKVEVNFAKMLAHLKTYGSSRDLKSYAPLVKGIRAGKFNNKSDLGRLNQTDGYIEYNRKNPKLAVLLPIPSRNKTGKGTVKVDVAKYEAGLALATVDALQSDLKNAQKQVSSGELILFLANLVTPS